MPKGVFKRATRQATKKAVEDGGLTGLVSPMPNKRKRAKAATVPLPRTNIINYREPSGHESEESPQKPPPPPGPTPMTGISFDSHQNKYEHEIDSPPPAPPRRAVELPPKKQKGRAKKPKAVSGGTSIAATSGTSSSDGSSSLATTTSLISNEPVVALTTAALSNDVSAPMEKRKATVDLVHPALRPCVTPGPSIVPPTVPAPNGGVQNGLRNTAVTPSVIADVEAWRNNPRIANTSPGDKMQGILRDGESSSCHTTPEKMVICSPEMTPTQRVEALQLMEAMKRQVGALTFQNQKTEQQLFEEKRKRELLEGKVRKLTEENERWKKFKSGTADRIRPLAVLVKVINDDFHVDREKDEDYLHWKNVLRG